MCDRQTVAVCPAVFVDVSMNVSQKKKDFNKKKKERTIVTIKTVRSLSLHCWYDLHNKLKTLRTLHTFQTHTVKYIIY